MYPWYLVVCLIHFFFFLENCLRCLEIHYILTCVVNTVVSAPAHILRFYLLGFNQPWVENIFEKFQKVPKRQNLNFLHTGNYVAFTSISHLLCIGYYKQAYRKHIGRYM